MRFIIAAESFVTNELLSEFSVITFNVDIYNGKGKCIQWKTTN